MAAYDDVSVEISATLTGQPVLVLGMDTQFGETVSVLGQARRGTGEEE